MGIRELRNKPFPQRLLYFTLALIVWFFIAYQINTSYTDPMAKAGNLTGLWILSTFVLAILSNIFFNKKKQDVEDKTE